MKYIAKSFGDYNKRSYRVGKHEFITVPSVQGVTLNEDMFVSFDEAESVYINGAQISNNDFQKLINIYAGRQRKSKQLTARVDEIKESNHSKCIYDACNQAERELL